MSYFQGIQPVPFVKLHLVLIVADVTVLLIILSMRSIDMRMVVKYTKNTKKGGLY